HSLTHEDVEHVLHGREVFLDRLRDGAHELHARTGQSLACLLELLFARQHLGEAVGLTELEDPRIVRVRATDVIQEAVAEIHRGDATSAGAPLSMRRLSCRSAWPMSRLSVTVGSRPPSRIAVKTAASTDHSCWTCSVAAARSRLVLTRSSSSKCRLTSPP